jgi:hypothetical protein
VRRDVAFQDHRHVITPMKTSAVKIISGSSTSMAISSTTTGFQRAQPDRIEQAALA